LLSAVQQAAHSILALSSANVLVPSPRTPACELVHAACAPPCPDTARRAHDPHPHRRSALRGARVSVIRPYHDATCSRATSHEGWWPFPKAARGGVVRADTGRAAVRHGRINLTNLPARVAPRPVPSGPARPGQASQLVPTEAGRQGQGQGTRCVRRAGRHPPRGREILSVRACVHCHHPVWPGPVQPEARPASSVARVVPAGLVASACPLGHV